jgi:hypothetical protein
MLQDDIQPIQLHEDIQPLQNLVGTASLVADLLYDRGVHPLYGHYQVIGNGINGQVHVSSCVSSYQGLTSTPGQHFLEAVLL